MPTRGREAAARPRHGQPSPRAVSDGSDAHPAHAPSPWWLVLGGFLILFNIWGLPITFGAFQGYYSLVSLREYSASAISWIGTVQGALLVLLGTVSGPLFDLGYWPFLFAVGSFLTVFGMMMLSLSTSYYAVFLSQGVCVGIGCGLLYVPTLSIVGAAFAEARAVAMGVITSGIALGGVIFTLVYIQLLPRLGFAWMVRVMGFINLAVFVIAAPLMLRLPPTSGSMRALFDRQALTEVPFLVFTLAQFFIFLGYLVPLFYIPTFAQVVLKTDESTALYILIGSQVGSLFGRIAATLPVRFIGALVPWLLCCIISGLLCFTWITADTVGKFVAFSVLYGFFSGALIALPPSLFPVICPDPKRLGSRLGISWTSSALAFLVGTPIAGALTDLSKEEIIGVQVWSGSMLLFSTLLLLTLWVLLARKLEKFWI